MYVTVMFKNKTSWNEGLDEPKKTKLSRQTLSKHFLLSVCFSYTRGKLVERRWITFFNFTSIEVNKFLKLNSRTDRKINCDVNFHKFLYESDKDQKLESLQLSLTMWSSLLSFVIVVKELKHSPAVIILMKMFFTSS